MALMLLTAALPAPACTLWSACGDAAGGGSIIAKNRDYVPTSNGRLLLVRPEKGLAYLGLFARVRGSERMVAGVNEAGLTMVSATAGSVPREERRKRSRVKTLLPRTLASSASLDAALAHTDFAGHSPVIYMLSDRTGSAWVEVGPGGAVAMRRAVQGTQVHTNHYLAPEMQPMNTRIGMSSAARLERMTELVNAQKAFTLQDFERMGNDRSNGPDDSIMRDGSTPGATRTMARFLVRTPPGGPPEAWVTEYDHKHSPWSRRLVLDKHFWAQARPGETILVAEPATGE